VDVDIVPVSVKRVVKDQRGVHEGARVDETASFMDDHFLDIKDKAAVENLECNRTFTPKDKNFFVSNLVGETHVSRNPFGLVHQRSRDFLPNITLYVVHLNHIHYSLLVYPASKGKDVLVFKSAESYSRPRNLHVRDFLPFIFLGIVPFTVTVHLVIDECAHDIDEALNGAK